MRSRSKRPIPAASRRALADRHGCRPGSTVPAFCAGCGAAGRIYRPGTGKWVAFPGLEIDHIVPEFLGGTEDPGNLQLLCRPCNRSKGWRKVGV